MAIAGNIGAEIAMPTTPAFLFGEDQARYAIAVDPFSLDNILAEIRKHGISHQVIGKTGGKNFVLSGEFEIPLQELTKIHLDTLYEFSS